MYYLIRHHNKYNHDHFDFSFYYCPVDRNVTSNNESINFSEMYNSGNEETVENTVVDEKVQEGLHAEAISKDPCAGTASGAVVGEADMAESMSSELESTMDSITKEIARDLAEHYKELTKYAIVMNEIIDIVSNKEALQSEAHQEQKMVNECFSTEAHEPLNCSSFVHRFVQSVRDYTQIVFDSLGDDVEADDYTDDDDDCF